MRILMLDKNWLIDRRIALMIDTLQHDGHEFRVLHVQPPSDRWERTEMTVPTMPIPMSDTGHALLGDGLFPMPPHVREAMKPGAMDSRRAPGPEPELEAATLASSKSRMRGKLQYFLKKPEVALDRISAAPLPLYQKLPALAFFSALNMPKKLNVLPPNNDDIVNLRIMSPAGVPLDYWDKCALRYAATVWRPDIVCANDYPALRAAVEMKRRFGCKIVFDAHELYSYQPGIPHNSAKHYFREERILLRYVDGLILINEQHQAVVQRDSPFKGPIALCANATRPPTNFDITKRYNLIRQRTSIPDDHKIMIFQGGINTGRRVDFLLKGLAQARNRKVHMVFLTFGGEIPIFKEMARDLGIGPRTHFLPFVPWQEVLFWAASADCGMMPYQATDQNTAISSPNKMYEFITGGVPMIGSADLANVHRIIQSEGFGVTVPLRAVSDYARAIDLMFDEDLGGPERFRPALIERAHKYHWDAQVAGVVDLYRKIVGTIPKSQSSAAVARA